MTDAQFPNRLTQLRSRWEADPASRIFLQLAEEYRHLGQMSEALKVLETGLREHPGYLSAQIAKGRCLLELGHPAEARDTLERVVKQDATQMVANKLLVRAYVETGQTDLALERLELYTLLHESDPEIDELRRRIQGAIAPAPPPPTDSSRPSPALVPEERSPFVPTPPPAAASGPAEEDLFALSAPAAPPRRAPESDDIFDLGLPAAPAAAAPPPFPVAAPPAAPVPADTENPFPDLAAGGPHRSHLERLQAEGLFFFEELAAPAASVPAPAPAAAAVEEDLFGFDPLPSPVAPPPPAEFDELGAVEAVAEVAEVAEAEWPEAAAPAAASSVSEESGATVTLGELYLRQGHLGEAERIFREVLQREPENLIARQALSLLEQPPAAEPPVFEAPVAAVAPPPAAVDWTSAVPREGDLRSRKVSLLTQYLERIRRGSVAHVR